MAHADDPDQDAVDDGPSIERNRQARGATDPSTGRPGRAAVGLGVLVTLVAGAVAGFVLGGSVGDGAASDNPDLQALCIVVGMLDDAALDRLEAGESSLDDRLMFRISAIPQLAQAASRGDGAPEGLAEVATQTTQGLTRMQPEEIRTRVEELRTYC